MNNTEAPEDTETFVRDMLSDTLTRQTAAFESQAQATSDGFVGLGREFHRASRRQTYILALMILLLGAATLGVQSDIQLPGGIHMSAGPGAQASEPVEPAEDE